jgi:hypothetical protein
MQVTRAMEARVSLANKSIDGMVRRLVNVEASAARWRSWRGSAKPSHGDEQHPLGVVKPQDGSSNLVPKVVGGYRTKTRKIPPQPRPQTGIAWHHPCSTGAHMPNHCRGREEGGPRSSEGSAQGMPAQQTSPIQAVLWPLEKHLMTAQITPEPSQHQQD